jgi:hypothetical protein
MKKPRARDAYSMRSSRRNETAVGKPGAQQPVISSLEVSAATFAALYSLTLAACGGFVFCTSIRPVSIAEGVFDWPWVAAFTVVAVTWLVLPVPLLILGLVSLHHGRRLKWRLAAAWTIAVAVAVAIGYANVLDFGHWFSLNTHDIGWAPPPCSPSGSSLSCTSSDSQLDWPPLLAAGGELAAGAVMIALIAVRTRR